MLRRSLLKALLCSPLALLLGKSKSAFDPDKSYGNCLVITDLHDLDKAWEFITNNANLVIPPKYRNKVEFDDSFRFRSKDFIGRPVRIISWIYKPELENNA